MRCLIEASKKSERVHCSQTASSLGYHEVERRYGCALQRSVPEYLLLTKKWQDEDLVWPHSDVDLRVVLAHQPRCWLALNETIAAVHRSEVADDPVLRRVLEHPPGFVFLAHELDYGLLRPAEIATWSSSHGETKHLDSWKAKHAALAWTDDDEDFYWDLLVARTGGRYRLANDAADNVSLEADRYPLHCVFWHYFAPCHFAASALGTRSRPQGKTATLSEGEMGSLAANVLAAARKRYYGEVATDTVLTLNGHDFLLPVRSPPKRDVDLDRRRLTMAIAALRCRPARFLYYLDPGPGTVTDYLIDREGKEVTQAIQAIRNGLHFLNAPVRQAAVAVIAQFSECTSRRGLANCLADLLNDSGDFAVLMNFVAHGPQGKIPHEF